MSAAQSGSGSGPGAPGQDDPAALVEDINRTRAELGDTVEALVAKVDVKAQARQRAAEVSNQAKGKLLEVRQRLTGQFTGKAEQARQVAAANGKTMLGAGASGGQTVQRGAQRAARTVNQHRVPVAAAAVGAGALVLVGWLVVRRRRR